MHKGRVLIVEDETLIAMELKDRLERNHYTVCGVVSCGEEAIGQIEQFKPDVALMDVYLAGKLNGIETTKQLRTKRNIPVIYLTAYSDPLLVEQAAKTEPYGYLVKPFEERELRATIDLAIYKHMMDQRVRDREQEQLNAPNEARCRVFSMDSSRTRQDGGMSNLPADQPRCSACRQAAACMFSSIASSGITTHYQSGTEVIRQFMPNTGVHVVCTGAVAISETGAPQKSVILDLVSEGGILGIVECSLDLRHYHFSARTLTDSIVTFFPLHDIQRFCREHSGNLKVLAKVSQALRQLERRYVLLGIAEASNRLIVTLLWLSGMDKSASDHTATIPFELTSAMLSSLIGTRPETVTRIMSQFRAEGLISYSNGRLVIADRESLRTRCSLDPGQISIDPLIS